jgi:hypothetical protein
MTGAPMNSSDPGIWRGLLDILKSPIALAIIGFFIGLYVVVTILNMVGDAREERDRRRREEAKAGNRGDVPPGANRK